MTFGTKDEVTLYWLLYETTVLLIVGAFDLAMGSITVFTPNWALNTFYGYDPLFYDPDPEWSSYKAGFLHTLTYANGGY